MIGALVVVNVNGEKKLYSIGTNMGCGADYSSKAPMEMELPDDLEINEIYTIGASIYILSKNGDLYGSGSKSNLGINESTGFTEKIIKLNIDSVETLYPNNVELGLYNEKSVILIQKNGKYYCTGNSTFMYGNDMLQKDWSLVASNVKYFDGRGSYYVDKSGDLWVAGDSRIYGLGEMSESYVDIPNYIKCTDTNISGKVEKAWLDSKVLYVLLNTKELFVAGLYRNDSATVLYPGWEGEGNKTRFEKILDNVSFFSASRTSSYPIRLAITANGEVYGWGIPYNGANGMLPTSGSSIKVNTPTKFELPETIGGITNIKDVNCYWWGRTAIITNSGELFLTGSWHNNTYDGGHTATKYFSKYTYGLSLGENEKISSIAAMNGENLLMVTDAGRVFGYGRALNLGINQTNQELMENRLLTGISNIDQITAGSGFYIAVTKDGKVYGTGSNKYGILGRWIGIDRNSPNSRYKTAYEWVECPELEI